MVINSIADLKQAIANLKDDLPVMVMKPDEHVTRKGKVIPVAVPYEIDETSADSTAFVMLISQNSIVKEVLAHPEDSLTEEELEKA